jgi:hypothetical protein
MKVDPNNRSEHGLAHVIPPRDLTRGEFINQAWKLLLAFDLGSPVNEPEWLDDPILSRITISSPRLAAPFRHLNAGQPWIDQVKPFNFILVAHIAPLGYPGGAEAARFRLITTYNSDVTSWPTMAWRNLYEPDGHNYHITTERHDARLHPRAEQLAECHSFRTLLNAYLRHPESKYAAADGSPCGTNTRGELSRRHLAPLRLRAIGKETNELDEVQHSLYGSARELSPIYAENDHELKRALNSLKHLSGRELARHLEVDHRTIDRVRAGSMPRNGLRQRIVTAAKKSGRHAG